MPISSYVQGYIYPLTLDPQGPGIPTRGNVRSLNELFTIPSTKLLTLTTLMSGYPIAAASSSPNFQLIFNNALIAYEKRTKKDLLSLPLATELRDCDNPSKILALLYQQVQRLDQSLSGDDQWIKWLDPTVSVLHMLSEALEEAISLVSLKTRFV